ncbi:MAG: hypothetical protein AMXMBFR82_46600 [Candidatus Hydrogenedentota bacterium]
MGNPGGAPSEHYSNQIKLGPAGEAGRVPCKRVQHIAASRGSSAVARLYRDRSREGRRAGKAKILPRMPGRPE